MKLNQIKPLTESTKPFGLAKKLFSQLEGLGKMFPDHHFSTSVIDTIPNEKYSIRVEFARAKQDDRTEIGKKETISVSAMIGAFGKDGEMLNAGHFSLRPFASKTTKQTVKAIAAMKDTTPEKAVKRIMDYFKKNEKVLKGEN